MSSSTSASSDLAQRYQRKTDKQHVLDNPGMYIGSVELVNTNIWVFSGADEKILQKNITYIPALYKLFDEVIVNARDHVIRMIQSNNTDKKLVTSIDITINDNLFIQWHFKLYIEFTCVCCNISIDPDIF